LQKLETKVTFLYTRNHFLQSQFYPIVTAAFHQSIYHSEAVSFAEDFTMFSSQFFFCASENS